jgi:hypothetical protein
MTGVTPLTGHPTTRVWTEPPPLRKPASPPVLIPRSSPPPPLLAARPSAPPATAPASPSILVPGASPPPLLAARPPAPPATQPTNGAAPNGTAPAATPAGESTTSVVLDGTQLVLDVTGMVDPTPVSDGSNAVISLFRGDWTGAAVSAASILPGGDILKVTRVGERFTKLIARAAESPAARKALTPLLKKMSGLIDKVPLDSLPAPVRDMVKSLKSKADDFLTGPSAPGAPTTAARAPTTTTSPNSAAPTTSTRASTTSSRSTQPARVDSGQGAYIPPPESPTGFYSPNAMRDSFGPRTTSTTMPPPRGLPNVRYAGRAVDVPLSGGKSARVVFDKKGYPIFDDVSKYTTHLNVDKFRGATYTTQMRMATRDLRDRIDMGQVSKSEFTNKQLADIRSGKAKIDGYTWHHNQDTGKMQLVPKDIHAGVSHVGWESMHNGR